jgi:hypothetical protein
MIDQWNLLGVSRPHPNLIVIMPDPEPCHQLRMRQMIIVIVLVQMPPIPIPIHQLSGRAWILIQMPELGDGITQILIQRHYQSLGHNSRHHRLRQER